MKTIPPRSHEHSDAIQPDGDAGGGWKEVDMSTFVSSNWNDLAAMNPPGLVPCGLPNGLDFYSGRECTRSRIEGFLYFGYNHRCTKISASWTFNNITVPPRNPSSTQPGAPSLELWCLAEPVRLRLEFTLSKRPINVFATRDDWEEGDGYEKIDFEETETGKYSCETPFPAKSVIIISGWGEVEGKITKMFTK